MALGCPVIPAGPGNTEPLIAAIAHLRPERLRRAARLPQDRARQGARLGADVSSLDKALVSGAALPPACAPSSKAPGIRTRQAYATADLGAIAWETDDADGNLLPGMLVNDDLIVEIVTPGTNDPAPEGKVGEVVVTRLAGDYPLLRFATGDLSAWARPAGSRAGWAAPTSRSRSGACSSIRARSSRPASAIRNSAPSASS